MIRSLLQNIENILTQSIISSLKFNELITFDDGTANILKNSMLYQIMKAGSLSLLSLSLWSIMILIH